MKSSDLTTTWILLRMIGSKLITVDCSQKTPNWTGFCKMTLVKVSAPTTIGNCRTIPAQPTYHTTMLVNFKIILTNLEQPDPCVTIDKPIYKLAKQIQRQVPFFQDMPIRLDGFHRTKNSIGVIGKRTRSSALREIFGASEVYSPAQIEGILDVLVTILIG